LALSAAVCPKPSARSFFPLEEGTVAEIGHHPRWVVVYRDRVHLTAVVGERIEGDHAEGPDIGK
jgi:hypothetical protein